MALCLKGIDSPPDIGIDLGVDQAIMYLMAGGKTKIPSLEKYAEIQQFIPPHFS